MKNFTTWTERADANLRMVIPYGFMLILFMLGMIAVPYSLSVVVKAPFLLMAIYYWCIYRPTMVPAPLVFFAGILIDITSGLPMGLNALVFVAAQWFVIGQRRFLMGQSFVMIWIGFALLSAVVAAAQWGIFGLVNLSWLPIEPSVLSTILGLALFPLICVMLRKTHKSISGPGV